MVQNNKNQKGVSLIITLFIMIIILAVVLSISTLLYSEIKVLRNVGNSVVGLYAADSGIEKVLYYDRQYKPSNGNTCNVDSECPIGFPSCNVITKHCSIPLTRGLCAMFSTANGITNSCSSGGASINCNSDPLSPGTTNPSTGCNPDVCDDCTVSFNSTLDSGITYATKANVLSDSAFDNFEISSRGDFGGASRQIQISIKTAILNPSVVTISNLTADCSDITVYVNPQDSQYDVNAVITGLGQVDLALRSGGKNPWSKPWSPTTGQLYTIYVEVRNSSNVLLGTSSPINFTCNP
jgi:Tfp pilus assembly protein PilX